MHTALIICSLPELTPSRKEIDEFFGNQRRKLWKLRKKNFEKITAEFENIVGIHRMNAVGNRAVKKGLKNCYNHAQCGRTVTLSVSDDVENFKLAIVENILYDMNKVQVNIVDISKYQ